MAYNPLHIGAVLVFYAALYVVIRVIAPGNDPQLRKTAHVIGWSWAVCVFIANFLLFRTGFMSFLPWHNNFMHTFLWIGFCLTPLYLGVREEKSMPVQFVLFATFSLVVKVIEHQVLGTWELQHFFHIAPAGYGNAAYILGWSLADGLYPPLTMYGLRLIARRVPGLVVQ